MSNAKHAPKRKRGAKAVPVLGAAGLLSLAGGVSAATAAPVADALTQNSVVSHEITLGGNRRRQPGDILCFRQGKHRTVTARHAAGMWLLDGHLLHIRK
jgi:hypothetical protein